MKRINMPSFAGNALPTMDAAAIAGGLAFLVSELEKLDSKLREPLTSTTYPRDIPISSGGGWVEALTVMNVDYSTSGSGEGGGVSNSIKRIQADVSKDVYKVIPYEIAMGVKYVDVQRGNVTGRSIEQIYDKGIRLDFDKHMDLNTYVGFEQHNTFGLVNQPGVTAISAATAAGGANTDWAHKTPEEILADINTVILEGWKRSQYDQSAVPNHILIPPKQYAQLIKPLAIGNTLGAVSIMEYVKQNNIAKEKGVDLQICDCRWCESAGTGGKDRMVAYVNDDYFVGADVPQPLGRAMTQPNVGTASYDTLYMANVGQVKVHYIEPFVYVDGI